MTVRAMRRSPVQAETARARVDATLWSIRSALPAGGQMSLSAGQDRNHGELLPSWTLKITGFLVGTELSIELSGPILGQLLEDAIETLITLGIEITDEPDATDEPAATYTPVSVADPDAYPA
jgi:hypothetical protein